MGFLGRFFPTRKVGTDGKQLYKDNGEWGSFEGDLDANGNRHGKGKMTYDSGNYYEGSFVNDKYHGEKGIYHWSDGDEYEGKWKDGERDGAGIFREAGGTVDYALFKNGIHVEEGVRWSADRKTAFKLVDGKVKDEISLGMAEKLAMDKFNLLVPEPSTSRPSTSGAESTSRSVGFFGRLLSKRKISPDGKQMFKDYGDWGSYEGELDASGDREGAGKMMYESGNYYEGNFVNDKFHGDKGVYGWADGDKYEGQWKDGERQGLGVFYNTDGTVEYGMYEKGESKGEGVWWSSDRKSAKKTLDGEKKMEMLIEEAESFAKEKFDLPIPEISVISPLAKPTPPTGLLRRLFRTRQDGDIGPDGKRQYKDYDDWGSYEGEFDATGKQRHGKGVMKYVSGNSYEGSFVDNKFHGENGTYRWNDGDEYEGAWSGGERHGIGIFRHANGIVEYSKYEAGEAKGQGVYWSPDRKSAWKAVHGEKGSETTLAFAKSFAKDNFNLPVPEPSKVLSSMPVSKPSLLGKMFKSKENGAGSNISDRPRFEDYGDAGTYCEGDLVDGKREGEGKMVYDSGNSYEGDFSNNKFDGNRGLYRWSDGTEYEGCWKEGVFNGVGIYRSADGLVDYSMYKDGYATGVGVGWNDDYTEAWLTLDGVKMSETSLVEASRLAKDKFSLPAPERLKPSITSSLGRLFATRKVGPDGKPMFKDYGEWGAFKGDVDANGQRQGDGKMFYDSGNYYKGGFVNDKFHGNHGVYHWDDGDEYEGEWADGERHGKGTFKHKDGSVEYSIYEKGAPKGTGVVWSADRQTAHKLVDGEKKESISLSMAEKLAKETVELAVPEPAKVAPQATQVKSPSSPQEQSSGFFGRLFSNRKVGKDGTLYFKDYGDWGSFQGRVDANGNRQGKGKMTYNSGNYYEGSFLDDKYHGDKGVYHWADGDEYVGEWADGERHGKGSFRNSDGSVDYCVYEKGEAKGEGVRLSNDRKVAHTLVDGEKKAEILVEEAVAFFKSHGSAEGELQMKEEKTSPAMVQASA